MDNATDKHARDVKHRPAQRPVVYELCNVFGTPTGRRTELREDEPFPATPKGWSWKRVDPTRPPAA